MFPSYHSLPFFLFFWINNGCVGVRLLFLLLTENKKVKRELQCFYSWPKCLFSHEHPAPSCPCTMWPSVKVKMWLTLHGSLLGNWRSNRSCKAHDALTEKMLGKYDKLQYLKILNKGNLNQTSPFNVIGICLWVLVMKTVFTSYCVRCVQNRTVFGLLVCYNLNEDDKPQNIA